MKRIISISAILLAAVLLTGCPTQITAPQDFRSASPWPTVIAPEIDIGGDGIKHFVWEEKSGFFVRIIYTYTRMGEKRAPFIFTPQTPWDLYSLPDVAVRDNGDVYLAWVATDTDPGGTRVYCWQKIPAGGSPTNTCNPVSVPGAGKPDGSYPQVVTNGDKVYIVYGEDAGESWTTRLRYFQLEPLGASYGYVLNDSGEWSIMSNFAAAVEPDGTLHVAFASWRSADIKYRFAHCSNRGVTGNMIQHNLTESYDARYSFPAIAIDPDNDGTPSNDYVYVAFVKNTPAEHDLVYIRFCNQGGCTAGNQIVANMNPAWEWSIGKVSMAANSYTAYLIFVGNVGTAVDDDIFIMDYTGGSATPPTPTQLTTDDVDQRSPRVAIVSIAPVFAWVTEPMDVYVYHYFHWLFGMQPQLIHQHRSSDGQPYLSLAGRGDYVAGIGIDNYDASHKAPYVAFNAMLQYIPLIQR